MGTIGWLVVALGGVAAIVWGAEVFAAHLAVASTRLGVSTFALALLLAGAEPEELATAVTASLRDAPAIAFGDVIGANVAICLVALGVGAFMSPLPFDTAVLRYGMAGLAAGSLAAVLSWDGTVGRPEGLALVVSYAAFVAIIWRLERRPPSLGETAELDEAATAAGDRRVGIELVLVITGVTAMAAGAIALVEGIRRISDVEATQTVLGLTVVGFATALELVALAWSSARRSISTAVVAAVVGSFTYNVTTTLGAGALARPLVIADAPALHLPWLAMLASLALVIALAYPRRQLHRGAGIALLSAYPCLCWRWCWRVDLRDAQGRRAQTWSGDLPYARTDDEFRAGAPAATTADPFTATHRVEDRGVDDDGHNGRSTQFLPGWGCDA